MNRYEWMSIESNGGAEAEPHILSDGLNGKPEAYRHVLRQSRLVVSGKPLVIFL